MKKWIEHFHKEGEVAEQAHYGLPEGTYEREVGKEGFFGPVTHFYHKNPPTSWIEFEGDLKPQAFDTNHIKETFKSPWQAPLLLHNNSVKVRMFKLSVDMQNLARNADGDDLMFFHSGEAEMFCDYGHISLVKGDYFVIPRGTNWRLETKDNCEILMIESSNSSYQIPDKGLLGPNAVIDPGSYDVPQINKAFKKQQSNDDQWVVEIKRLNKTSQQIFPFNPLDTIGWRGNLMPIRINWKKISPVMSHRYHVPPSAHTTFLGHRFVICTFVPRLFETAEKALKIPFFHNNDDYDEVLFYHQGNFFSRDNIHPGMMTLHPQGFAHGPHPGALTKAFKQDNKMTDEVAVMIDTRDPLEVTEQFRETEWTEYKHSWKSTT